MKRAILSILVAVLSLAACTEKTPAVAKLDERSVSVGIMALQWPKAVLANSDFVVKIAVRNAGGVKIPSLGANSSPALQVNASYHWKGTDHRVVVWDGLLTPLDSDLAPGADHKLEVKVHAPPGVGMHILELDLVQTTAFWFGGVGSQTASVVIEVK